MKGCGWSDKYPILSEYHNKEWGVPLHDENKVFAMLSLDCFQAGLSWITILNKREAFMNAFDQFDIDKIALYNQKKVDELLLNPGIVRNRLKIPAIINNAQKAIETRSGFNSFSEYIWSFSNGKTIQNQWSSLTEIPVTSVVSDAMSKDMAKRGFKFVGSTICYAFMQSIGMVNDHITSCYRHAVLSK